MEIKGNIGRALKEKGALVGFVLTYPSAIIVELAALTGFDFVFIDGEHGWFGEGDFAPTLDAAKANAMCTMLRVRDSDPRVIGRALDLKPDAVIVPDVASAEQAQNIAKAAFYPPKGTRGFAGGQRASGFGATIDRHIQNPAADTLLIAIIESKAALTVIDEIVTTEELDGFIIGTSDLSASLGHLGDFTAPEFLAAVREIEDAVRLSGKLLGRPASAEGAGQCFAQGHQLLIVDSDIGLLRDSMSRRVASAKANLTRS